MADGDSDDQPTLRAGDFSAWMVEIRGAIHGDHGADVPCGGCTACCRSSQFVHIGPDETDTLSHIPAQLLFPAPRLPRGHVLLGYDERGHCPMLIDDQCSIYEHRPRTCRTYDCRVFPASGLEVDDAAKAAIARQVRRWRFSFASEADRNEHDAVRAAATFLRDHADALPDGTVPTNTTQLAVLAVEVSDLFLRPGVEPDAQAVGVELKRRAGP
jgi:Fe-S-cluster containining protein